MTIEYGWASLVGDVFLTWPHVYKNHIVYKKTDNLFFENRKTYKFYKLQSENSQDVCIPGVRLTKSQQMFETILTELLRIRTYKFGIEPNHTSREKVIKLQAKLTKMRECMRGGGEAGFLLG